MKHFAQTSRPRTLPARALSLAEGEYLIGFFSSLLGLLQDFSDFLKGFME